MLGNADLWDVAMRCHRVLAAAELPHVVAGGVAVCLHGYQRNTIDLDLIIRPADTERVRSVLLEAAFTWDAANAEFLSETGVPVQFLLAGGQAGSGSEVLLPSPDDPQAVTEIEALPVLSLVRLIEKKTRVEKGTSAARTRTLPTWSS